MDTFPAYILNAWLACACAWAVVDLLVSPNFGRRMIGGDPPVAAHAQFARVWRLKTPTHHLLVGKGLPIYSLPRPVTKGSLACFGLGGADHRAARRRSTPVLCRVAG